jgi:hypothetical protein
LKIGDVKRVPNTYSTFEDAGIEDHLEYVVVGLARLLESGCTIKR